MENQVIIRNQASKTYPDIVVQFLFVLPMLLCYCCSIFDFGFLIAALIIQLGVGGVQLLSGLFFALVRKSQWHTVYFVSALLYLLFLGVLLSSVGRAANDTTFFVCVGIFNCLIPVGIAIWYLYRSWDYHKNYVHPLKKTSYGEEDLLDDIFQVEN